MSDQRAQWPPLQSRCELDALTATNDLDDNVLTRGIDEREWPSFPVIGVVPDLNKALYYPVALT